MLFKSDIFDIPRTVITKRHLVPSLSLKSNSCSPTDRRELMVWLTLLTIIHHSTETFSSPTAAILVMLSGHDNGSCVVVGSVVVDVGVVVTGVEVDDIVDAVAEVVG